MKRISFVFAAILAVLALPMWTGPATAADKDVEDEGYSAYSVARLKVFEGTAWVRMPDSGEWEEYSTNTPIPERARVNIPEKSEAELQFHGGQFVLLTEGTEVDIRKFEEGGTTFRLRSGEIRFDLPADDFSPVNVAVPGGKTNFGVPGRYWLKVGEDGKTYLVVRSGEGAVAAESGNYTVKAGEEAAIGKDVRVSAYQGSGDDKSQAPAPMTEEEQKADVPPAAAYELREYGEWVNSSEYGTVWRPRVAAGWSPYYYGHWVWISPYGWTWVSYEPWGWYPYHYGWWYSDPIFGWCWSPFRTFVSFDFAFGSFRFRHFHRNAFFFPATVRFVRDGGFVRWVPLRPGERFVRSGFTRTNARLAGWERPLPRGTVFVRNAREGRNVQWRNWSGGGRARGQVVVRETDARQNGTAVRRGVPQVRDERPGDRPRMERTRPEGTERMRQPRNFERQERMPQREFRGREGRYRDGGSVSTGGARPETRVRSRDFREMRPPARVQQSPRESTPRVVAPPPYRGGTPRGEAAYRRERPSASPPQRLTAPPERGPAQRFTAPDRGSAPRPPAREFGGGGGGSERGNIDRGGGGGGRR